MPAQESAQGVAMVCFDWGGVILKHCRSWAQGCAAAGLDVRGGNSRPLDAPEVVAARRALTQKYQRGEVRTDEFFATLAVINDGAYTEAELRHLHRSWLLEEYADVYDVIVQLTQRTDITTGLLSNTNEDHWLCHIPGPSGEAARFPTAGLLQHRFASHELGAAKPDDQIYRMFEAATGFAGDQILFFDDLAENCAAAERRGWRTVQVDHEGDTGAQIRAGLARSGIVI